MGEITAVEPEAEKEENPQAHKLEALGQFAGGIAHDFNNILSIIEGHTHIAVKQLQEGTLRPEQLQKIIASTRRGAGLTRQLLAFARQKIDVDEKTDVVDVLRQQQVLLAPLLGAAARLHMRLPAQAQWVNATADQVTQIVLNLALNARDAMTDGGDIVIECFSSFRTTPPERLARKYAGRRFVRISFSDSGKGIPPEILPRIFDPFFTTKGAAKGTGLGLSVVYGIVDQLGGAIEARSAPGEGAVFDIYLPLHVAADEIVFADKEKEKNTLDGKTILVAEDEPELRDVLAMMLDDMNLTVLTASNGNHALLVQEEYAGRIDFLLTDVVMPEMDGVRLGSMFQSLRPDTNVVYMSGYPFLDGNRRFSIPEDAPFISKPLQEDKIRKILERALERRDERTQEDE